MKKEQKTEVELRKEVEKQQEDKFIADIKEVEEKHGYKLIPIMHYSYKGIVPQITVEKQIKVETKTE